MLTEPPLKDAAAWDSPLPFLSLLRVGLASIPLGTVGICAEKPAHFLHTLPAPFIPQAPA